MGKINYAAVVRAAKEILDLPEEERKKAIEYLNKRKDTCSLNNTPTMKCKTCGKELQDALDKIGESLGLVCKNSDCSECGVII